MSKNTPARSGARLKAVLVAVLVAPVGIGLAMLPSGAAEEAEPQGHDHADHAQPAVKADMQRELARVRAATARFHDLGTAVAAGYELGWVNGAGTRIVAGCVAHATAGAMGYHYFNAALMRDDSVDPLRPEVLVYAPTPDGGRRLVAVEWVVRGPQSNPPGPSRVPSVLGMDMHVLAPPPGPAFFLTHAWVWAPNPDGMFADWNRRVSCG